MHVRGEGSGPNYPVGGNAVGRGVEPTEGDKVVSHCKNMILHTLGIQTSSTDPFCKAVVGS